MTSHSRWTPILSIVVVLAVLTTSCGDDEPDTTATFTSPSPGASVAGGVAFTLAAEGVTIEPSGEVHDNAGHFHVIADAGCVGTGEPIPKDADHVHLGSGAAEGMIYLGPGTHELCVQVGDGVHLATETSSSISVEVGVTDLEGWCTVVGHVDAVFDEPIADGDFAAEKVVMVNVGRLVAQLDDGLAQVDADQRDNVAAMLQFVQRFVDAVVDAETPEEADANAEPLWELDEDPTAAAQPWILDRCGIDISGDDG